MAIQKMATDGPLDGQRWPRGELCHQPLWQPAPRNGRSDKALGNQGEISWRRTTNGQIHQGGVNLKLSQQKCPQQIQTLDFECQSRQVRGGLTME